MTEITPELRAAIDVAKERVKVDSYFGKAQKASFQARTQGLWSGGVLGLFAGGIIGAVTVAALAISGLTITGITLGLPFILGVAAMGAGIGMAGGMVIGAPAGAAAGTMAEKERREKAEKLEQEILASPEKQREAIEAYRKDPVVEKDTTTRELFATYRDKGKAWNKIFDLKTALLAAGFCAVMGIIVCAGAVALAGGGQVAMGAAWGTKIMMDGYASAVGIGAITGGAMGSIFGFNFPLLFTSITEKAADLLSGKMVRGKTQYGPVKTVTQMQQEAVQNRAASEQVVPEMVRQEQQVTREIPLTNIRQPVAAERIVAPERQLTA